jgi:hypothetical protein
VTFADTLDRTVQLYRAHFRPLILISAVAGLAQIPSAFGLEQNPRAPGGLALSRHFLLAFGVSMLFWPLIGGAFSRAVVAIHEGAPVRVGDAYRTALRRYPTLFVAGLLTALATVAAAIPLVLPCVYVFLGFFAFSSLAIMAEGLSPWEALRRSWRLARGLRGRILGLAVVWGLLQVVLSYAIGGALGLLGVGDVVGRLAQQLSAALIAPCHNISLCLIYFDARARREGHDLAIEAQRLAAASQPPPS